MDGLPPCVVVKKSNLPGEYRIPECASENIGSAIEYRPRDGDLFLCSYPKCGVTWLQNIVWRILHEGKPLTKHLRDHIPFLEFDGSEGVAACDAGEKYRVIKTHFPYAWVPKHPKAKYIFIAREPKDVCVSLYYHIKGFPAFAWQDGSFNTLFDAFLRGKVECCDYFDALIEWYAARNDSSVLFLLYEDLITNTKEQVLKIAKFLGDPYCQNLVDDEETILAKIVDETSFLNMQKENEKWTCNERTIPFVRKGVIGDWKNHMTAEQAALIEEKLKRIAQGCGCENLWKNLNQP